jgi:lactoylglutathione lyase
MKGDTMVEPERMPDTLEETAVLRTIGIGVSDLKTSVDFYTRICGMKEVQSFKLDHMDEVVLSFSGDNSISRGSRLLLMHWTDGSEPNYKNNPIRIILGLQDIHKTVNRVRAEGYELVRPPSHSKVTNMFFAYVKDPDGYLVELLQLKQ